MELQRYAHIQTALQLGHARDHVLSVEALAPDVWDGAEARWSEELADAAFEDEHPLIARFAEACAEARRRLARKLIPLDNDPQAWVDFLDEMGRQLAPSDWLEGRGLDHWDLLALGARWSGARLPAPSGAALDVTVPPRQYGAFFSVTP